MAFRFCDSFDHYATAQINQKWTQQFGCQISTGEQRNGPNSMFFQSGLLNPAACSKTLDFQTIWTVGFAMFIPNNVSGLTSGGTPYNLVNNGFFLMGLALNADFTLGCVVSQGGVVYGNSSPVSLHMGIWYYIECQNILSTVTIGVTTYVATNTIVRINGLEVISTNQQNLNQTVVSMIDGRADANRHVFNGVQGSALGIYMDDLYITDGQAAVNNGFLGDVAIGALYADLDATPLQWSIFPTTPTTHFTKINEEPPDGDTTYIFDNNPGSSPPTSGDQDNFDWQHIATFVGTVPAVHFLFYARKDDEGSRGIAHTIGGLQYAPGTGGVLGTPVFSLSDNYSYYAIPLDNNPADGGAAWTAGNFNSETFGVQVAL